MWSRRRFAACALCAVGGVLTAEIGVKAQAPGLTRTVLNRTEFPGDKMITLQLMVDIEPNFLVPRHTHPGVETTYVKDGGGLLGVKGQADRKVAAGDAFQIPNEIPHFLQNGPEKTRIFVVYVVDKEKPLVSPAPE